MKTPLEILAEKVHSKRRLFYASLELTYSCNFACKFCYNPVGRAGQERTSAPAAPDEQALEVNEVIALMENLRKAGVLYFTLTGGEPMVHPRFWEIAESAKEKAFALRIFTNGALIDEVAAERFGKIMPNCIELSLYGASNESYGKSSGRPEAFPKVLKAVELLKDQGVTVYLKCMLTKITEKEMDAIQEIADKFNCPLNWDPVLQQSDDGQDYPLKMLPAEDSIRRLFSNPRFHFGGSPFEGEEGQGVCNIGRNLLHIDPWGNIFPCIAYRQKIGNIRTDNISELWQNSSKLKELMKLSVDMGKRIKESNIACRYCMGKSNETYKDPTRFDDAELTIAKIRKEIEKEI